MINEKFSKRFPEKHTPKRLGFNTNEVLSPVKEHLLCLSRCSTWFILIIHTTETEKLILKAPALLASINTHRRN